MKFGSNNNEVMAEGGKEVMAEGGEILMSMERKVKHYFVIKFIKIKKRMFQKCFFVIQCRKTDLSTLFSAPQSGFFRLSVSKCCSVLQHFDFMS